MPPNRRFPKGTMIRVWRTTLSERLKGKPRVDHQVKVYEGPERRSGVDRRKGLNQRLRNVERMWEEMRTPKDGMILDDVMMRLEKKYIAHGRRKNDGFRLLKSTDVGVRVSIKLQNASLQMADRIESYINKLIKKGVSRSEAVKRFILANHLEMATNPRGTIIGFKCAMEKGKDGVTIIAYNPLSKKYFWTSTRRTKLSRREPNNTATIEVLTPPDENAKYN